jgi:hypothetical protein
MKLAKSMLYGITTLGLAIGSAFADDASLGMSGAQAPAQEFLIAEAEPVVIVSEPAVMVSESAVVYELRDDTATLASQDESWSNTIPTARNGGNLPRDPTPE